MSQKCHSMFYKFNNVFNCSESSDNNWLPILNTSSFNCLTFSVLPNLMLHFNTILIVANLISNADFYT